jgi:hypothetical protein
LRKLELAQEKPQIIMTIDRDDGFGDDPFGVSADVFGKSVEDVDVWKAQDSFSGDKEWMNFNTESDDESNVVDKERGREKSASLKKGEKSPSKPRRKKSPRRDSARRDSSRRDSSARQKSPRRDEYSARRDDSAKSKRKKKKEKPEKARPSSRHLGNHLDEDNTDSFNVGVEGSSVSSPTSIEEHSHRHKKIAVNDGFGDFGSATSSERPRRGSMSVKSPRQRRDSAYTDDVIASQYRTSSSSGASSSRKILLRNTERKSNLVRRRDGTVSRQRPSERNHRADQSDRRRGAIEESLFAAVGEEGDPASDISLSTFLRHDSGSQANNGSGSVHSAPAATGGGKSRRYNRRMSSSPKQQEPLKLDIAQLAKSGYIEVHDGKMRLVIDVEA